MNHFQRKEIFYKNHKIMTYSFGEGDETLLLVSGGPGCPCNFLRDTHGIYADKGFRVVTWDQLGCGESDAIDDPSYWEIDRSGKSDTPTPLGSFKIHSKAESSQFETDGTVMNYYYLTKFNGDVAFHSLLFGDHPFVEEGKKKFENREPSSMGCVRLLLADAKWIYDEIGMGATVEVFNIE